ncbi:hypothetical protein ACEWY4_020406 [Coilia grayii]|uniref:Little elongation complex subunit 1 C-terminal domain-containing protein n=1 Tax=Coilia grayii TaxID=363190 RepID=A0ABD1JFM0_9TELE
MAPFEGLHKSDVHMLEELERTKGSLKRCRDGVSDESRDPEAKTLKDQIIFQLKILQDSNLKQSAEVAFLQKENKALECKLQKAQEKLGKLEKEANKERRSSGVQTERRELCSTVVQTDVPERRSASVQAKPTCENSILVQTDPTEESMMDLGKIRRLVVDLWHNVDPQSLSGTPLLPGTLVYRSPPGPSVGQAGVPVPKKQLSVSHVHPSAHAVNRAPVKSPLRRPAVCEESLVSVEDILRLFMPLPPLLSPVHHPDYLGASEDEDVQLSEEEEDGGEEHHIFKEEDMKEVLFSSNGPKELPIAFNGLKRLAIPSNGQKQAVFPTETPPTGKPHRRSLTGTQEQEGEALCLQVSMNVGSQWRSAFFTEAAESLSENQGSGEEKTVGDEDMESEIGMDEQSADEACSNSIVDAKCNPFAMYSSSCESKNKSIGDHSSASAGPATDPHHNSGSGDTNGFRHSNAKVDNTEEKHTHLVNGSAALQSVKGEEIICDKEQTSHLKPSSTDCDKIMKLQDKDQTKESIEKYTGETLRSESLKGEQNGHDQNHDDVTRLGGVGQNGHQENLQDPMSSRFTEPEQNPQSDVHDLVNPTLREEKQTGQPHTPSDELGNSSVTKQMCEAWGEKPSEDRCEDTESSEDLDRVGLQRKVRMAQSRRESHQSTGGINGSLEKEESKEEPWKDLTCSLDIKTPSPVAQGEAVEKSAKKKDTIIITSQNKNTDQPSWSLDDALNNGLNAMSALKNEQNAQPEAEPGTAGLPQVTEDKPTRNLPKDMSPLSGIHSPESLVTNGTSTLNYLTDGAVHGNGFEVSGPPSRDEGIYTRVKSMRDCPRPVCAAALMAPVESLQNIRSMMGPPLRPLLLPLLATPPRSVRPELRSGPVMARLTQDGSEQAAPASAPSANSTFRSGQQVSYSPATTPSPCKSVPSSPLQFGSATPKHAVPVPCRHPVSALNPISPAASVPAAQENSMQMLDSMYPELSAQARTLSILRGNVSLARPAPEPSTPPQTNGATPVSSGFNSVATAFTKTQQTGKRVGTNVLLPKSAKKLRLGGSPVPVSTRPPSDLVVEPLPVLGEAKDQPVLNGQKEPIAQVDNAASSKECIISQALAKLASSCLDLLPVVRSHVFIKRISSVPILTDEEKEVLSDFCTKHKSLSEDFLSAILAQLKTERTTLGRNSLQSLCRVYTALCRQNDDRLKANTLAYSLLKEDFPDAAKLVLFMVTTWPQLLTCGSALCKAIHAVVHIRAEGEVLQYLSAYLHWESNPPCDVPQLVSSTLAMLCSGARMQFQHHSRHGDDLCPTSWEYIFTIDLLCVQQKWKWTHDIIISKELWPIMNMWATQPRSQKGPIADVTVAAVLRLIGRLGQQGMKEKFTTAVRKIASVINVLGRQGQAEGVPWEVQLATVYTIYDLSPSNPKEALAALAEWRGEATGRVPPGITSCLTQISSLSRKASS